MRFLKRYVNGTKGVISIFLAILMVPFVSIAGMLINAGRINSAVAIFDEALCNASNSTLGTYDEFLRSRFALMAISQDTSNNNVHATGSYSADTFIDDLFNYYMEKNVGSLSSTYNTTNTNAVGLYQLANTSVLEASVLQASKFTVPAKLVADWGSIDEIIDKITKPFSWVSKIGDFVSAGADTASSIKAFIDAKDIAEKKITACETAITYYDNAYNSFMSAVNAYNTLIDQIIKAQNNVASYQSAYDSLSNANQTLIDEINKLKEEIAELNDKLEGLERDTSEYKKTKEAIKEKKDDLQEKEDELKEKSPDLAKAQKNLDTAKANLENYENQQPGKRNSAESAKQAYLTKIAELTSAVEETKTAVVEFQAATTTLINNGANTIKSGIGVGFEIADQANRANQQELNDDNSYYEELKEDYADDESALTELYNMQQENNSYISELKEKANDYSNAGTVIAAAEDAAAKNDQELQEFAAYNLANDYDGIITNLNNCKQNVESIKIPKAEAYNEKIILGGSMIHFSVEQPVKEGDLSTLIARYEKGGENNYGIKVLKALFSFLNALFSLQSYWNPDLHATIDTSLYNNIGGLPSKSSHPLNTQYDAIDSAQSQMYKELLNSYSAETVYDLGTEESVIERLMGYLTTLAETEIKLKNFKKLWDAAKGVKDCLCSLAGTGIKDMLLSCRDKIYIAGYICYNTANRTTYSKKALSGASYNLPISGMDKGYAFNGAETEYILGGKMDEYGNQNKTFWGVLAIRMVADISCVLTDATVLSVISAAASASFGILGIVVGVAWIYLEAFVDTVILVNSGSVPILKTTAYLTPSGIIPLITKVCKLKFTDAEKQKVFEGVNDLGDKMDVDLEYDNYKDYSTDAAQNDKKLSNLFDVDYTKALWVLMLFWKTDTLCRRLADIIQMEATYYYTEKKKKDFVFDLDKSYTYLRASGSFTSNVFIKVGEDDTLTSTDRVIYNGY